MWKRSAQPRLYRYIFTSSTNWTVPSSVKSAYVSIAGGGSGGVTWNSFPMISGSSGGFLSSYPLNLTPGQVITITIGAGGPVRSSHVGINGGGTTTFGSYLSCTGGGASGMSLSYADVGNCGTSGGVGLYGQYINTDTNNANGYVNGGQTPLLYGSGGGAGRCDGCVAPNYAGGSPGKSGVVIVDVLY